MVGFRGSGFSFLWGSGGEGATGFRARSHEAIVGLKCEAEAPKPVAQSQARRKKEPRRVRVGLGESEGLAVGN